MTARAACVGAPACRTPCAHAPRVAKAESCGASAVRPGSPSATGTSPCPSRRRRPIAGPLSASWRG
eukprot:1478548-Lingulodinium_polyedra.AAC.1